MMLNDGPNKVRSIERTQHFILHTLERMDINMTGAMKGPSRDFFNQFSLVFVLICLQRKQTGVGSEILIQIG